MNFGCHSGKINILSAWAIASGLETKAASGIFRHVVPKSEREISILTMREIEAVLLEVLRAYFFRFLDALGDSMDLLEWWNLAARVNSLFWL